MRHLRFTVLLLALLLLLLTIAIMSLTDRAPLAEVAVSIAFIVLLVVGGIAVAESRRSRFLMVVLASTAALSRIWLEFSASLLAEATTYLAALAVLSAFAVFSIRYLLRSKTVHFDTLAAALFSYAVLAVAWAAAYSLLELMQPDAFTYSFAEGLQRGMRFGLGESATSLYFSLVTITTLGYGDIVPASDFARLLVVAEALTGQMYVAILVAKLVAQFISAEIAPEHVD